MTDRTQRRQVLLDALETRILVLDGAMGTMVQQKQLPLRTSAARRSKAAMKSSSARAPT